MQCVYVINPLSQWIGHINALTLIPLSPSMKNCHAQEKKCKFSAVKSNFYVILKI